MERDFQIIGGIYLAQPPHRLDLHNDFNFCSLQYSVKDRILLLCWQRSGGDWVVSGTPISVSVEFRQVSEFHFRPRDAKFPFTEDDCVHEFGYWPGEEWKGGVLLEGDQVADLSWLTAIRFMSGAMILVQAASARAVVEF